MRAQWGDHGDDFFNMFGLPEHDQDQQVLNAQIPANAAIEIQNPRGDVSITAGDATTIQVQAHEVAYADSDDKARKIFDSEAAHVTVSGNAVLVKSDGNNSGRVNLTVDRAQVGAGHGERRPRRCDRGRPGRGGQHHRRRTAIFTSTPSPGRCRCTSPPTRAISRPTRSTATSPPTGAATT